MLGDDTVLPEMCGIGEGKSSILEDKTTPTDDVTKHYFSHLIFSSRSIKEEGILTHLIEQEEQENEFLAESMQKPINQFEFTLGKNRSIKEIKIGKQLSPKHTMSPKLSSPTPELDKTRKSYKVPIKPTVFKIENSMGVTFDSDLRTLKNPSLIPQEMIQA